jgi:hypothetical protein
VLAPLGSSRQARACQPRGRSCRDPVGHGTPLVEPVPQGPHDRPAIEVLAGSQRADAQLRPPIGEGGSRRPALHRLVVPLSSPPPRTAREARSEFPNPARSNKLLRSASAPRKPGAPARGPPLSTGSTRALVCLISGRARSPAAAYVVSWEDTEPGMLGRPRPEEVGVRPHRGAHHPLGARLMRDGKT